MALKTKTKTKTKKGRSGTAKNAAICEMKIMSYSIAVANEFLKRALVSNKHLTQMQIQKLVYITHGWNLAIAGEPLTDDAPEAWEYGPVYPRLWESLRRYGSKNIKRLIEVSDTIFSRFDPDDDGKVFEGNFSTDQLSVINRVYEVYGDFKGFQLSAMTHEENTPWFQVYKRGQGKFDTIPDKMIKDYFIRIV